MSMTLTAPLTTSSKENQPADNSSSIMTSNGGGIPQGRTESFKGKKRGRSEYEQQQQQAQGAKAGNNSAAVKAGSARTRGVLLAFVDKALSNARLGDRRDYNELLAQFQNAVPSPSTTDPSQPEASTSKTPSTSPQQLKSWLEALVHAVNQLDGRHAPLVEAVASLPWTTYDEPVRRSFIRFVCVLVAARPEHLRPILNKAVLSLRWDTAQISTQKQTPQSDTTSRRTVYNRIHTLLRALLDSVPTLTPTLLAALERWVPPKRHRREAHVAYFQNVLRVLEYCPQICEDVLQTVVARAVKMDVEIQVDIEEWEDDAGDLDREIFGYHIDDVLDQVPNEDDDASEPDSDSDNNDDDDNLSIEDLSDVEEAPDDSDDEEGKAAVKKEAERKLDPKLTMKLKRTAAKLDAILKLLFAFLRQQESPPASTSQVNTPTPSRQTSPHRTSSHNSIALNNSQPVIHEAPKQPLRRDSLFEALLAIFDRSILRAFKTRHTQFLIFWYASIHPDFADAFIGTLLHRSLYDGSQPAVMRVASGSYLASFISRASFLDAKAVQGVVSILCDWLDEQLHLAAPSPSDSGYLPGPGSNSGAPGLAPNQYAIFYAVTQAMLYVFCYRWKDLVAEEDDQDEEMFLDTLHEAPARKWLPELQALKNVITSSLNPLKVCTPAVVAQFVRIAAHVDFCWCYNIVEANKRASKVGSGAAGTGTAPTTPLAMPTSSIDNPGAAPSDPEVLKTLQEAEVETHFPFEPFKLPLTKSYIDGIYKEFESPEGLEEDDQSTTTTDDDADPDESASSLSVSADSGNGFSHRGMPIPFSKRRKNNSKMLGDQDDDDEDMEAAKAFSKSFEAMSISPNKK